MRTRTLFASALAAPLMVLCGIALIATPAQAACQKLGFSVNDYGKKGPADDAKKLLDKYIADYAKKNGIKSYRTGKKEVTCELFLDVGLFDEYTCKAVATLCWKGKPKR
ncbi:MAG TPA: hypothetical protein VMX97_04405 [Hyphomicrobiaceae bacterium]|nr:hypothetical protein [Hyphomicrobiaceae bacterium]